MWRVPILRELVWIFLKKWTADIYSCFCVQKSGTQIIGADLVAVKVKIVTKRRQIKHASKNHIKMFYYFVLKLSKLFKKLNIINICNTQTYINDQCLKY